jgi:demethylmenaquinone methyltransferase/2-methoxy-6-polyprenyl-1,4-benzoquinol methylase
LVNRFFSGTGASYRRTAVLGTLGLDRWWKHRIVQGVPPDPSLILDQASGTGILTLALARRFPRCRVIGVELRREYASLALRERERLGLRNVEFVQGRAEDVTIRGRVDCITSSYLAKYADMDALVVNAAGMLREGGVLLLHDFTYPDAPVLAGAWELYLRLLGWVWGRTHPVWREALAGLPRLVRDTTWVADSVRAMGKSGFDEVSVQKLTWGAAALVRARRRPPLQRETAG